MASLPFFERPFELLPAAYGREMLLAYPRDGRRLFACWELTAEVFARGREEMGWARATLAIRAIDVEDGEVLGSQPVKDWIGKRYLHDIAPGSTVRVALGLVDDGGHFSELLTSEDVTMPGAP